MEVERLARELERFSTEKGMSYSKIAKAMGIGTSTLSEFRNGNYKGDITGLVNKVEDFLERHKKRMRRIDFCADTEVKKRVYYVLDIIKKYVASNVAEQLISSAKIGYIFGRAGIGKTHALQQYRKDYKGRIIFITAEANITIRALLIKIGRELKIDTQCSAENLKENIKNELRWTESIIVIDEGEHLKPAVIDIVRSIGDQTGVGIVIAGTEVLKSKVYSQKKEYEYLYSRAVVNMTLKDLGIEDVSKIVHKFLEKELDLYTDAELQQLISLLTLSVRGSARQLDNLLSLASEIANKNLDAKITTKYIKAAVTMLAI